jgi:hypothetical protein
VRYKGRPSEKTLARDYPHCVEIEVPLGGLGRQLDAMHDFHRQHGIKDQRGGWHRNGDRDFIRWRFADADTAAAFAQAFGGVIVE